MLNNLPAHIVSASEFRSQMFSLYNKYLSADAIHKRTLIVKNMKNGEILFEILPVNIKKKKKEMEEYIQEMIRTQGQVQFDDQKVNNFRKEFNQEIEARSKNV